MGCITRIRTIGPTGLGRKYPELISRNTEICWPESRSSIDQVGVSYCKRRRQIGEIIHFVIIGAAIRLTSSFGVCF